MISFSGDMPIAQSRNFFDVSRELLAHIGRLRQGIKVCDLRASVCLYWLIPFIFRIQGEL